MRIADSSVVWWLGLAMIGAGSAGAQEKAPAVPSKPVVALQTVYLQESIGRAHRILIRGELGGKGQVTLDGNTCTIDQFGDPGVCTRIHFPAVDVRIVQIRLADPTGQGRRLFRLEGELEPPNAQYYLVVPRRRSQPHRLVVNLDQDHRRVVTLETRPEPPPSKPGLCRQAKYRARQVAGKVTIDAEGEHRTAGWRVALEQLPIRIFPPQYRLVCIPPAGTVAQVITPFDTSVSFAADQPVAQVVVHDAAGRHKVPVERR